MRSLACSLSLLLLTLSFAARSQQTVQEQLGYPKDTRLLIIHADDMGSSHSENMATIEVMEKGVVNSGSIMVPCPWFAEIAEYARLHPEADLGLHLTLTSEWKKYKWGPVASSDQVPSLLDEHGYLNETLPPLMKFGKAEDVEKELRSQIELAIRYGIQPTHFDEHMAGAVVNAEFLKVLIKLGHEYRVPVLITKEREKLFGIDVMQYVGAKDVVFEKLYMAEPKDYDQGLQNYYTGVLRNLPVGLNILLLHAAYDNDETRAVTAGYNYYAAKWRQIDTDFFKSDQCRSLIAENKIVLITWKEIRNKLYR
jgi:chitin disaccharide deacetylase